MEELSLEEEDEASLNEAKAKLSEIESKLEDLEFKRILGEPEDASNAIVSINAGAGGTEAQDWADMLLRMYLRYAERSGFQACRSSGRSLHRQGRKTVRPRDCCRIVSRLGRLRGLHDPLPVHSGPS